LLKFGSRFIGWSGALDQIRWGKLSEECGFDFCWFAHDNFLRSTWPVVSIVASQTKRIKLPIYTSPYGVSPDEATTLAATIDEISDGRVVLCIGGHTDEMLKWVGQEAGDEIARTREAVEVIRRCLKSFKYQRFEPFNGKVYHWGRDAYLRFQPARENIPIYISPHGEDMLILGGEIGDGCYPMVTPPEAAKIVVGSILEGANRAHRKRDDIDIVGFTWISISKEDPKKAAELLKPAIAYFGPFLQERELEAAGISLSDFTEIKKETDRGRFDLAKELVTDDMLKLGITGTVSECVERIAMLEKMGINQVSLGGPLGPNVAESLRIIGSEIITRFR
jgi:5,10-methylenetetrahydromethanopterin reductase